MTVFMTDDASIVHIALRREFTVRNSELRAQNLVSSPSEYGHLPRKDGEWLDLKINQNRDEMRSTYVVFSGSTPIAWEASPSRMEIPEHDYGIESISRHQAIVRFGNSQNPLSQSS